jgi:hypothetical protein
MISIVYKYVIYSTKIISKIWLKKSIYFAYNIIFIFIICTFFFNKVFFTIALFLILFNGTQNNYDRHFLI